ncbi:MAG: cytochrome c biogenesis protein CcsA [Deltaproteobacteria bacterium]|nr:cytochrome c biogenesis protein CcsA [Deltaproteobacteria bacterium]
MEKLLLEMALISYFISTTGYVGSLIIQRIFLAKIATWLLAVAFCFHTATLFSQYFVTGQGSVTSLYGWASLFAWAIAGPYLFFQIRTKTRILGAIVSPLTCLLVLAASQLMHGGVLLPENLKGPLVMIHVILSVTGEALFVLVALAGMLYLIQDRQIKNRRLGAVTRILPPLKDLDRINHYGLLLGFPVLTFGLLSGAAWAGEVWGSHWQWDPKLIWALLFWLCFAFILHQRLAIGWSGHKAALLSVTFLLGLLASLTFITLGFSTIHSFR